MQQLSAASCQLSCPAWPRERRSRFTVERSCLATAQDEEASNDLSNADIVTKYRTAGDIVNKVVLAVVEACKPGAKAVELCTKRQLDQRGCRQDLQFQEGRQEGREGRGLPHLHLGHNCVGHYSPLTSEDKVVLAEGDIVKIDMGVHVDGYVAVVAHTCMCTAGTDPMTGRKADVCMAAWTAAEAVQRMLKDGCSNNEITKVIAQVAESYKCNPVEGVLSHQMKKHVIDANKTIINKATPEQQVAEAALAKNDVFAIDVVMSTGEGKPKASEDRTTVFKRNIEEKYSLKMKASRAFFSEVNQRFPPCHSRFAPATRSSGRWSHRGVKHDLFIEYPVLYEKPEEFVAQYKFTALLLPSGNTARITGGPPPAAKSDNAVTDEKLSSFRAEHRQEEEEEGREEGQRER